MISLAEGCRKKTGRFFGTVGVAVLMIFASSQLHAGPIPASGLLTVDTSGDLRSYTFAGTFLEELQINLPTDLVATSVTLGVSVLNGHLYVGLTSTNRSYLPKIVEVDPATGDAIHVYDTAAPYLTAFGDDGKNLLLMDPLTLVNNMHALTVYTYTPTASLVGTVNLELPFPGTYQANGMDGDGTHIFSAYYEQHQPILTNLATGPKVDYTSGPNAGTNYFNTNLNPQSPIQGLAFNPSDSTLWITDGGGFQHYDQMGNLLSQTTPTAGGGFTGLEVIPLASVSDVPEPSTFVMFGIGVFGMTFVAVRRRRTQGVK